MTVRNVAIAVAILTSLAHADNEADRLFKQGRKLLAKGDIAAACDAFAQSDAHQERVGTLLNLADCREQNGQLATAWATFLHAASVAQDQPNEADRADEARKRAGYLQPRLSYLTISVPEASDVDGLVITRDGKPIDRTFWNQGVPVDGGSFEIEASAPGRDPWRTTIAVAPENAHETVEVPRFQPIADLAPKVAPPPPPATVEKKLAPVVTEPAPTVAHSRWTTLRYASLAAAGVAVAGVAVGALEGLASSNADARATALCPQSACANQGDLDAATLDAARARHAALVSNLSFAGAAVAAAGAVTLWIVGKPSVVVTPDVGRDHVAVALTLEL